MANFFIKYFRASDHGPPPPPMMKSVMSVFRWVEQGFPHHVCVVEGRRGDRILQFARDHAVITVA